MSTKKFPLRDVLTITTGRLLTKGNGPRDNGIGNLYDILGHMTGDNGLMTHQLGRFSDECKPWLLKWFPELAEAERHLKFADGANSLDIQIACVKEAGSDVELGIQNWLSLCVSDWGMKQFYEIGQIPPESHSNTNPIEELVEMMGGPSRVAVVTTQPE